jgi:hypothetical protein
MRHYLRGWARDLSGKYKLERDRLNNIIDYLDKKAEIMLLSDSEREALTNANKALASLRRDESPNGPKGQRSNIFRKGGITLDIFTLLPMGNIGVKRSFNLNKTKGLSLVRKISKNTYLIIIRHCSGHPLIQMFL